MAIKKVTRICPYGFAYKNVSRVVYTTKEVPISNQIFCIEVAFLLLNPLKSVITLQYFIKFTIISTVSLIFIQTYNIPGYLLKFEKDSKSKMNF